MSSEEIGIKVLGYLKEVVRRSIMLALVASAPVACSTVEAEYVKPPANGQIPHAPSAPNGLQASDGDHGSDGRQAPSAHLAPHGSETTTGTQVSEPHQALNGSRTPQTSHAREESPASEGIQASKGDQTSSGPQASDDDPISSSPQTLSDRHTPAPERRSFLRWLRRSP